MKLKGKNQAVSSSLSLAGVFFALTSVGAHAGGDMLEPIIVEPVIVSGSVYLGVFGGGGSSNKVDMNQYGTALFLEDAGGPLSVDTFGQTNSRSMGMIGAQVGYQWTEIPMSFTRWTVTPAFEVEGYYVSKSDFTGHEISSNTTRLDEHDFDVTFPTKAKVFLINSVLNLNVNSWLNPYVGAGVGGAVLSVSDAEAFQVSPPELGVNHYSANTSDTDSAFAGQVKLGLNFAVNQYLSVFAEYRWLYVATSSYIFGSTVYPGHAATTAWRVDLGSQTYNMGVGGIRLAF